MNNPLRSEAAMFRVVVAAGVAAVPVIALGLLVGPTAAVLALGVELGIGIGLGMLRRRRSAAQLEARIAAQPPAPPPISPRM